MNPFTVNTNGTRVVNKRDALLNTTIFSIRKDFRILRWMTRGICGSCSIRTGFNATRLRTRLWIFRLTIGWVRTSWMTSVERASSVSLPRTLVRRKIKLSTALHENRRAWRSWYTTKTNKDLDAGVIAQVTESGGLPFVCLDCTVNRKMKDVQLDAHWSKSQPGTCNPECKAFNIAAAI
jgi:hypothetical protein